MSKVLCFFTALGLVPALSFAQINDPAPYCASTYSNQYNMLGSVKVNGGMHDLGPAGSFGEPSNYKYFNTFVFPNLVIGANNTIDIVSYAVNDGEPIYFAVYIDINKNNTFEAGELLVQNSNTINAALNTFGGGAPQTISKTFMLPATALPGQTRMRVTRGGDGGPNSGNYQSTYVLGACGIEDFSYGITYDYNVNLSTTGGGGTVGINEVEAAQSIGIYPVPASDIIQIDLQALTSTVRTVGIINLGGQKVRSYTAQPQMNISVADLANGVYFLQFGTDAGTLSRKIVVSH